MNSNSCPVEWVKLFEKQAAEYVPLEGTAYHEYANQMDSADRASNIGLAGLVGGLGLFAGAGALSKAMGAPGLAGALRVGGALGSLYGYGKLTQADRHLATANMMDPLYRKDNKAFTPTEAKYYNQAR